MATSATDTPALKVTGEFTPNPQVCTFRVNRVLADPEWTLRFQRGQDTHASLLIDALFDIDDLEVVQLEGSALTITKAGDRAWPVVAREILQVIKTVLAEDAAPVSEAAIDAIRNAPTEDIQAVVARLFEEQINPVLAQHGGFARLVRVEGPDVFIQMGGGCQGCSASKFTLRNGIENAIRKALPQVRRIEDVTDHASGENPYYQ